MSKIKLNYQKIETISNINFLISLFVKKGILFENKNIRIIFNTNMTDSRGDNLDVFIKIINKTEKILKNFDYVIIGDFS